MTNRSPGWKDFQRRETRRVSQRGKRELRGEKLNNVTEKIIGAAIEVHRKLGPGLLESAYRECLAREFLLREIPFEREKPLPIEYKGVRLECGYRLDFLVNGSVVVESKAIEAIAPIHEAQLVTSLSLGGWNVGLLINFNVLKLVDGVRRRVLNFREKLSSSLCEKLRELCVES